jgi:Raf kinase inhibitor-like YbhB/YbcL family protein
MEIGNPLKRRFGLLASAALTIGMLAANALGQDTNTPSSGFRLSSTTFANNQFLPISAIHTIVMNGVNVCSINGASGGNQSPELSWTGAPLATRTFVVALYDVTAAFTHWGMYNITGDLGGLPENAGVAGSPYGAQIVNDFGDANYDGPCPPPNVAPFVHHYVFTVYALDIELTLPSSANFPANAETLYQALIQAGQEDHILASASLTGLYSTTPPPN